MFSSEMILILIVALVLNAEFRGRGIVRAAILIPWAIPTIVSAKMWAWMLNDQFGILNDIMLNLGLIDAKIAWTASVDTASLPSSTDSATLPPSASLPNSSSSASRRLTFSWITRAIGRAPIFGS